MIATVSKTLKRAALSLIGGYPRLRHAMKGVTKSDPSLVSVSVRDTEMNAAIARARASLPIFWVSYASPQPSETGHWLKVRFEAKPEECIWMNDVKALGDGRYSGRFANRPMYLKGRALGDVAEFAEADIADWMFMRNGKIVGGETTRPLLDSLPKAEADAHRALLETP
jgi:uncharacterized protein YegJ (DUF2314 family)